MDYTYRVIQMQTDDNKAEGFVCRVFIEMTASNGSDSISYILKSRFDFDENQELTAFSELTENQVIDWVLINNGDKNINKIKDNLKKQLESLNNTNQITTVDLPWS